MKWFAMIFSFLLGQFKSSSISPSLIFVQKALEKSRSLVFLATVSFISALLFAAGILIAAINGFTQYDQTNSVYMSATFVGGLSLAILSGISLAIVFAKKNWQVPNLKAAEAETRTPSPIEEAVSLLLNDFIEDRRSQRQSRAEQSRAEAHPSPASQSAHRDRYAPEHLQNQIHS